MIGFSDRPDFVTDWPNEEAPVVDELTRPDEISLLVVSDFI